MNMNVKPPLAERFIQPQEWQWREHVSVRDDQFIRYGWAVPQAPRASVVIMPGLSEYCEKYFEVAHDLLRRRFAVACIDWRGQGMSWRAFDRNRRYHDDFARDVEDAFAYLDHVPLPAGLPRILLGHSMGGHIGLRVLHARPGAFNAAVLTAPMLGLALPEALVKTVAAILPAHRYMPLHGQWNEAHMRLALDKLTSDPDRRAMQLFWMTTRPDLRMGGLTASWARAALASIAAVRAPSFLGGIATPTLIADAGREQIVSNRAIARAALHLPRGERLTIDGALHEILMERDVYRNRFWSGFDAFVAKHLPPG